MFTRGHYILIAKALAPVVKRMKHPAGKTATAHLIVSLCEAFEADNPHFRKERFIRMIMEKSNED